MKALIRYLSVIFLLIIFSGTAFALRNAVQFTTFNNNIWGVSGVIQVTNPNLNGVLDGFSYHRVILYDIAPKPTIFSVCSTQAGDRFVEYGWVKDKNGYSHVLAYGIAGNLLCIDNIFYPFNYSPVPGASHTYKIQWSPCVESVGGTCYAGHFIIRDNIIEDRVRRRVSGVNKANYAQAGGEVGAKNVQFGQMAESMGNTQIFNLQLFTQSTTSGYYWLNWQNIQRWRADAPYANHVYSNTHLYSYP